MFFFCSHFAQRDRKSQDPPEEASARVHEMLASRGGFAHVPAMAVAKNKKSPFDAALAHQQAGNLEGAEAGFRATLEAEPDNPDALLLLGALLHKTKRATEAVEPIEKAIAMAAAQKREADPSWRVALAFAKRDSGDAEGALEELNALLKKAPSSPELIFLRAGVLQRLERAEEAIEDYQTFLKKSPDNAQALNNLGVSQRSAERLGDAYKSFARAVEIKPNYAQAALNAGQLLGDMGQREAAIAMLRRAHALEPDNRTAELALIDALQIGEQVEEAERLAEKMYAREPDSVRAMVQLGNVRVVLGKRESAVELARKAFKLEPESAGALSLLAETDSDIDDESLLARIEDLLSDDSRHAFRHRIGLNFSAARLCEKLGRHEQAFGHYVAGNAARHEQLEQLDKAYDGKRFEESVDRLIAAFGPERFGNTGGSPSELPVFIVGMPRSGTSLTEQILASHPRAVGAGELGEIGQINRWLRNRHGYPEKLPREQLKEAAKGYLTHVGRIGKGVARVTDKMPGNFNSLGLITSMFPKARIIHTRRNPMDNSLSCFAQNFRADGLSWSTDLEDLAHQSCHYHRLMDHWRAVLPPGRMLEIDYEETVADFEGQARRIVEFIGLEWDDACLRFYETERAVVTASRSQVRQPIYKSSVGRWKRYGDGVTPLVDALNACGCGPAGEAK